MASKQQDIFLHIMPTANSLQNDIVGNFSGNNHSPDNHLKPLSYAINARNAPLLSNQMIPNDSGILFDGSRSSSPYMFLNSPHMSATSPPKKQQSWEQPLLLKGFPNYLSASKDQIHKYSGCEGYTQKDTPIDSAAIKTAEHNNPFMNDHTILHTNPAWAVSP